MVTRTQSALAVLHSVTSDRAVKVDDEVLSYIASAVEGDRPELEAALIRVEALARLARRPVDVPLARQALLPFT